MEVGQKIKLVRLHRGLTQKQLGDLLNLGDGGANRIAQYEIGYRVPKPSLLKEIAKVLDVKEETFFVSDKYLLDILRTIMWYDFEHRRSFKLAEVTLDASIAPKVKPSNCAATPAPHGVTQSHQHPQQYYG